MRLLTLVCFVISTLIFVDSCKEVPKTEIAEWMAYDESEILESAGELENQRMHLKLIQSKIQDKNDIWDAIRDDIAYFGEDDYQRLKPLIYEQDILRIQETIMDNKLSYEELTKWYLYRIVKLENDSSTTLHTIIALNSDAVEQAKSRDKNKSADQHPIFGMPILLKDNINTAGMPTTAGALALADNQTDDAHIVSNLKKNGAMVDKHSIHMVEGYLRQEDRVLVAARAWPLTMQLEL